MSQWILGVAAVLLALSTILAVLVKVYRVIVRSKTFNRAVVEPILSTFETNVLELLNTHILEMREDMQQVRRRLDGVAYELHTNSGHSLKDGVLEIRQDAAETRALLDMFMRESLADRQQLREMLSTLLAQNEARDRVGLRYETKPYRDPNSRERASDGPTAASEQLDASRHDVDSPQRRNEDRSD